MAVAVLSPPASFISKLGPALESQAPEGSVDRLPSMSECAVHLELLNAIVRAEREVTAWGNKKGLAESVAWNMYSIAAARRFLKWSRLAEANKGDTPPLDVLIVWHAYMLNTAAYRAYEMKELEGRMGLQGINWAAVHRRIDGNSRFNVLAEDSKLPFPADLLGALRSGEIQVDDTIPSASANFDMVAAVQRQLKFAHKMHEAKWLQSPFASQILEAAISRYEMFFTLIAENPGSSLSPTPDIDLVWHTHQLSPKRYGLYSAMKADGRFVNHNDSVGKPLLQNAFKSAMSLFYERFGCEYQVCYCEGCLFSRVTHPYVGNDGSTDCSADSCASCGMDCFGDGDPDCDNGDSCHKETNAVIGKAIAPYGFACGKESSSCSGESCIPQTCSNSCRADCSGDSCQNDSA